MYCRLKVYYEIRADNGAINVESGDEAARGGEISKIIIKISSGAFARSRGGIVST